MKFVIFNNKKSIEKEFNSFQDALELCVNYCDCSYPIYVLELNNDGTVTSKSITGNSVIKDCGWQVTWVGNNQMNYRKI